MSWLSNTVLPKIRALGRRKEVPDNLWHKCPGCGQMIFHRDLEAGQHVCPHCDHHMRITAAQRLALIFDDGAFNRVELPEAPHDPLRFRDTKRYGDRLKDARAKSGEADAMVVAHGLLGGSKVVVAVQNFAFMGGSMGIAVGEAVVVAAGLAVAKDAPLVVFAASGGARMQEGIISLMQMPRTTVAVQRLREAGLPFLVVFTDPTTGGVTASFAMLGDIHIAEPGSLIGFAGPRVIEQTIRETLPEGFQRAEYLLDHGMLDMVVHRHQLRPTLVRILDILRHRQPKADVAAQARSELEIPPPSPDRDGPATEADHAAGTERPAAD